MRDALAQRAAAALRDGRVELFVAFDRVEARPPMRTEVTTPVRLAGRPRPVEEGVFSRLEKAENWRPEAPA